MGAQFKNYSDANICITDHIQKPNLFSFSDYTAYLKACGESYRQRFKKSLTTSMWARRLGYRSPQTVGMALSGARVPSAELVAKLSKFLGFSDAEHRYFELLVEKARRWQKEEPVDDIESQIREFTGASTKAVPMNPLSFSYIADWYHFPLRQLVKDPEFKENDEWICRRLRHKVAPSEVRQAIENMLHIGLLKRNAHGRLETSDASYVLPSDLLVQAGRLHLKQMMDRAKEAINEQDLSRREFDARTFTMDPARIQEAKQEIRRFRENFLKKFQTKHGAIFQLNFQFFEHTEK